MCAASPGREPYYKTHARYFCTCVEKKAQTSIRVSIAAPDNAISKEQCATHLPEGFTLMPLTMICLRRDIVFDSDFALQ